MTQCVSLGRAASASALGFNGRRLVMIWGRGIAASTAANSLICTSVFFVSFLHFCFTVSSTRSSFSLHDCFTFVFPLSLLFHFCRFLFCWGVFLLRFVFRFVVASLAFHFCFTRVYVCLHISFTVTTLVLHLFFTLAFVSILFAGLKLLQCLAAVTSSWRVCVCVCASH